MSDAAAAIEAALTGALDGLPGPAAEAAGRFVTADGRRLRGGLVLAVAGRAWPGIARRTVTAAAAVELLHLASSVRDEPATGDLLIGLATHLAASAGTGHLLGTALIRSATGHALDHGNRFDPTVDAPAALRVAELSAGSLFAAAARTGAVVTGTAEDGLEDYGLALGTALRLLDDLDTLPGDFAAGRMTLPVVHALGACPELHELLRPGPGEQAGDRLDAGVPATLRTAAELVERAAAAQPDLAGLAGRYRDGQLALVPPRYRAVLSS